MTGRTRAELEGRLARHLKEEVEHVTATIDIREQQHRLEERLRPIRRRRRPLHWSAVAVAVAMTAAAVTVAVLVSTTGNGEDTTAPANKAPRASTTFTSAISPLPGLRFTWPTPGWRAVDSLYDVVIHPPGLPGTVLRVSKGCYPTDPTGAFVSTRTSATAVISALRGLPALTVSRPVRGHIGDGLAAVHVDIRLSPSAPRTGFDYLVYRGQNGTQATFTIKPGMLIRVYAAVYRAPYGNELLNIVVEARTAKEFAQSTALAGRVLQTLRLPKGLVAGGTFLS